MLRYHVFKPHRIHVFLLVLNRLRHGLATGYVIMFSTSPYTYFSVRAQQVEAWRSNRLRYHVFIPFRIHVFLLVLNRLRHGLATGMSMMLSYVCPYMFATLDETCNVLEDVLVCGRSLKTCIDVSLDRPRLRSKVKQQISASNEGVEASSFGVRRAACARASCGDAFSRELGM